MPFRSCAHPGKIANFLTQPTAWGKGGWGCGAAYHCPAKGKYSIKEGIWNIDEGPTRSLSSVAWLLWGALSFSAVIEQQERGRGPRGSLQEAAPTVLLQPKTSRDASQTEAENCGESTFPSRINWTSFILQIPSLLRLIAALCLECASLYMRAVLYFSFKYVASRSNLAAEWDRQGFWFLLHFLKIDGGQKGVVLFLQRDKEIACAETAGGRTVQKLSLRQTLLLFILWKWGFIFAVLHSHGAVGSVWSWDVPQTLPFVILQFYQYQMLWHQDTAISSLCSTPFSLLLHDTFNMVLICIFSVIPPCGAAHDNDHVVKWAPVPLPMSHVGTPACQLAVQRCCLGR